ALAALLLSCPPVVFFVINGYPHVCWESVLISPGRLQRGPPRPTCDAGSRFSFPPVDFIVVNGYTHVCWESVLISSGRLHQHQEPRDARLGVGSPSLR